VTNQKAIKKLGVYIGRFQPLHNAHYMAILKALNSDIDHLVIVLGSACQAKTIKNPWTTYEREKMIRSCLTTSENDRVSVVFAKDYLYNDNLWLSALQSSLSDIGIHSISAEDCDVTLFGHDKDKSTFYLHLFPNWTFQDTGNLGDIDATRVRNLFFTGKVEELKDIIPAPVYRQLVGEMVFHAADNVGDTTKYEDLVMEYQHILEYKKLWSASPYPPTFVTTDAVVIKSGHVLVVKRRGYPGRGLLALPGGFLNQNERVVDCCLRELKEETQIAVPKDELKKRIIDQRVFDHPDRSLRGRTITHAFCIDLGSGPLPKVKGDDDAEKAFWMPLRDVLRNEEDFFEDHFHIIFFTINKF
jgi:bifunctional NMN adenylyltransferase/nudix hydrolase